MSNRNNHQNKQAARERMRAERERQAKKDRARRQLIVGGAVVGILAIAGGIGYAVTQMNGGGNASQEWKTAAEKKALVKPAHTTGPQGTTVIIGNKSAKNTLHVYEDMRCPICAQFEQYTGTTLAKDIKNGTFKAQYTMGTFLDDKKEINGSGSKNALSALGAALNVSPDAFLEYKSALYSAKNHPTESDDAFASDQKLIAIAQQVKELKGNTTFEKAVTNGTYDRWALAMSKTFDDTKDVTGTPTFKLNGKILTTDQGGVPLTPDQFTPLVQQNLKK
ncbi:MULTISPECIES: thioredoxin domain-containing protein [Streptomyces]|uniref:Thioredoxin domain-containing protein n=1 Tax=Streptomyces lonegramiae TaxID=3075524 RepID=A0ABU2XFU5_9ACTN|nr:thioredoxin domain-containing protein [Streptomyces sp. DSM 41529]MDT0544319.1 thioredoxin domain-containing protein [Streptomyces sp. DSM 41529]